MTCRRHLLLFAAATLCLSATPVFAADAALQAAIASPDVRRPTWPATAPAIPMTA